MSENERQNVVACCKVILDSEQKDAQASMEQLVKFVPIPSNNSNVPKGAESGAVYSLLLAELKKFDDIRCRMYALQAALSRVVTLNRSQQSSVVVVVAQKTSTVSTRWWSYTKAVAWSVISSVASFFGVKLPSGDEALLLRVEELLNNMNATADSLQQRFQRHGVVTETLSDMHKVVLLRQTVAALCKTDAEILECVVENEMCQRFGQSKVSTCAAVRQAIQKGVIEETGGLWNRRLRCSDKVVRTAINSQTAAAASPPVVVAKKLEKTVSHQASPSRAFMAHSPAAAAVAAPMPAGSSISTVSAFPGANPCLVDEPRRAFASSSQPDRIWENRPMMELDDAVVRGKKPPWQHRQR